MDDEIYILQVAEDALNRIVAKSINETARARHERIGTDNSRRSYLADLRFVHSCRLTTDYLDQFESCREMLMEVGR